MASAKFQPSVKQTSGLEGIRSKQSSLCLGLPMPKDFPKWCCLSDHVAWKGSLERSELEKCSEGTHGEKLLSDAKTVGPRARPCSGAWAPSIDALVQATSWLMVLHRTGCCPMRELALDPGRQASTRWRLGLSRFLHCWLASCARTSYTLSEAQRTRGPLEQLEIS